MVNLFQKSWQGLDVSDGLSEHRCINAFRQVCNYLSGDQIKCFFLMISHSCKQMYSGVYFWTVELKAGNSWPNRLSDLKIMLCFWLDKYCHTVYMEKYNCANDNRIGNLVDWDENIEYRLDIPGYELCASIQFRQIFHILKKVDFSVYGSHIEYY